MPMWQTSQLMLDEDAVLRGQGMDPLVIRQRKPKLLEIAQFAMQEGPEFLVPQVLYQKLKVEAVRHEQIILENGKKLSGSLVASHLGPAEYVVLLLCTVGEQIDEHMSNVMKEDVLYGLALDGVGSAAVEALANAACKYFEDEAAEMGWKSSIPLSPGMVGWDVGDGQPEIFNILDGAEVGVELLSQAVMHPRKSLTMVIGFGPEMNLAGKTCDLCAMNETCRYKDHYDPDYLME